MRLLGNNLRTIRARKNIAASFLIKGASIAIGLILFPMTISYLNPTKYGIWITLSSLVAWFSFFDIGLGNGLRNKLAEALAVNDKKLAKVLISTAYAILIIIVFILLVVFFSVNPFLNWNSILNANTEDTAPSELTFLAIIIFSFFSMNFVLRLIRTILEAHQRPAFSSFFDLLGKVISLVSVFVLVRTTDGSLLLLAFAISLSPFIVLTFASVYFFNSKYKMYRPSINHVDFSKARTLFSLGVKFFIIQIAVILLYQTNNIIITQIIGPSEVTTYNVAFKYCSVITMGLTIIVTPYWSAITDAWTNEEFDWIRNAINKLILIFVFVVFVAIVMLLMSETVYKYWIGDSVQVPFFTTLFVTVWIIANAWNNIFAIFLNGVGKVKLQLLLGIGCAIVNVPLAIFLGKYYGMSGILVSNIILSVIQVFIYPIQYRKLINHRAVGIWNK
jgi:O-antigen/teichoic acid export membrane protein